MSLPRYKKYEDTDALGLLPAHWQTKPLKWVSTINDEALPETTPPDYQLEYVDIGSVSLSAGIEKTEYLEFKDAPSRARRIVRDGDVLVSTVRTYLKAIAPIESPPENLIASTGFAVVRPNQGCVSGFLKYSLQSERFVDEVIARSTGVSYPAINASDLGRIYVPAPPVGEQTTIAAFLDRETAKIDGLIAEQEKLISLLAEKRQATISHAVTKGLNPDAPMKDSGVSWLGEVPAHWDVVALKYLVSSPIIDGPHETPVKHDNGIPFVSAESLSKGFIDFDKIWGHISPEDHAKYCKRYSPMRGDILIVKLGATTGTTAIVETDKEFNVWVPLAAVRLQEGIEPKFVCNVLKSNNMKIAYELNWTYGTQQTLGLGTISNLRVPIPPIEEQKEIVKYLDSILPLLNSLSDEASRGIALLKERRSALVSAAVTGKIDVRHFAEAETA
ncbi:MAG: restriction endonuclease subunit S [Betaproteobacteria bacterium HGW-Betaproteobacteria-5]|jgi:type I restriction enzyme S subunit|nr:MAG: restriction endonuclease subunit S [Betaproteobacteria bacterium HGW-Betaproteobacteria-5]PKO38571.1 MAG: restriction endonuclease subunit S [Betaproteobacteria bacterium HGW-Betaproteobacteria-6]